MNAYSFRRSLYHLSNSIERVQAMSGTNKTEDEHRIDAIKGSNIMKDQKSIENKKVDEDFDGIEMAIQECQVRNMKLAIIKDNETNAFINSIIVKYDAISNVSGKL